MKMVRSLLDGNVYIQVYKQINMPKLSLLENKIIFSQEAINLLEASPGDRIAINYIQVSNEETFPIIGKSDIFGDSNAGNKLTKSHTMSFRGVQQTMLRQFGKFFELQLYKNKMYKLTTIE